MAWVYILYSIDLNRYYIGSCNDLEKRIGEHRHKVYKSSFTSKANDWELFLAIDDLDYKQARKIELHIKKMRSVKYINDLKRFSEMRQRLIERFK